MENSKARQTRPRKKGPTRQQIAERTRRIQEEWSETTRRRRAGETKTSLTIPETRITCDATDAL